MENKNDKKTGHYFYRVEHETPTRFWINNPTIHEAKMAIGEGAVGCTTNPSYVSKLLAAPEERKIIRQFVDLLAPYVSDDHTLAGIVQRLAVARLSSLFMPLYTSSENTKGFVTIQGNPFTEDEEENIFSEGLEARKINPNIMVKIPVTLPGIGALKKLINMNIPVMATEIMGVSQMISICESYQNISSAAGRTPPFYVTHITGILDDYFKQENGILSDPVSPMVLKQAGITVAKHQYKLMQQRHYPGRMIGGGARKLEDFTEFVGGAMDITINWQGTADLLLEKDFPVESKIHEMPGQAVINELLEKLPGFSRAYNIDGMEPAEFYAFGGVELFRNSFIKGWQILLDYIAERRNGI